MPFDPAAVPTALRERPQWVCWKYILREGKQSKCPRSPRGGVADPTDPATWGTFDEAVAAWRAGDFAGVGYVFCADDPFCGIDLDACIDGAGEIVPSARDVIASLASYSEVSPSGRGVKSFIVGRKPEGARCKSKAIKGFKETEVYDRERFFVVTGRHVSGTPPSVEDRQAQLEALCARLWPAAKSAPVKDVAAEAGFGGDDEALIARACAARNGDRFRSLFAGDLAGHGDDHSGADQALCNHLAFWCGRDAGRIDRVFRRSGLMRPKWDERRGDRTYGQRTIDNAIAACTQVYSPGRRDEASVGSTGPAAAGAVLPPDGLVPLGQRDPVSGRLVLSPRRTLPTAVAYVREFNQLADGRTLHGYGGLLMEWRGNRYVEVEEDGIRQRLQPWLHGALRYVLDRRTGEFELQPFESNPTTVKQALETVRSFVHLPASRTSPSWLDETPDRPPALEILPCRTMSLHVPTGLILPPTPQLFTTSALDFDYDPDPPLPMAWMKFLGQLLGEDLEALDLLQEWIGYCLISDTSQQKMLVVVGPRRSGKGTVGRVLTRLVGEGNVVGPTTSSLAGNFGLQPLIGKSLAIVSDARFAGEHAATVVERLLCISGEDRLSIDRKFIGAVSMKLPTRFVFLSNELPRLADASAALAGRCLVLKLTRSFYGEEDITLTDKLVAELPGILHWALGGWKRLKARGHFVQPASGAQSVQEMEDLGSPVGAFVREQCVVGTGHRVLLDDLYEAWCRWCTDDGRTMTPTKTSLGKDLAAVVPGVTRRRGTDQVAFYEGIRLR